MMDELISLWSVYLVRYPGIVVSFGLFVLLIVTGGGWLHAVYLLHKIRAREIELSQQVQQLEQYSHAYAQQLQLLVEALNEKIEDVDSLHQIKELCGKLQMGQAVAQVIESIRHPQEKSGTEHNG